MTGWPYTRRMFRRLTMVLALTGGIVTAAAAQPSPTATAPAAKPADVASPDAILDALYSVISGPAGQKRDWDRFHSLFLPGQGRLIMTGRAPDGAVRRIAMMPAEYVARSGASLEKNGFFEVEIHRVQETFGNITHAFSTYESRRTAADETPFARGINSIQLFNDGTRWYVVTVFWDSERPDNPIPAKYLPARK